MSYITTISGKCFDPINPEDRLIDIGDIAHSLSLICRFNGHTKFFYSVAQHSLDCSKEAYYCGLKKEVVIGCLFHDASEAYLSDVTRPVKENLLYYLEVENKLQNMIWKHFIGRMLSQEEQIMIFEIDDRMLSMEFHQLMPGDINNDYKLLSRYYLCEFKEPSKVERDFVEYFYKCIT